MAERPPRLQIIFQRHSVPLFFVTFNTHQRAALLATVPVHEAFLAFAREATSRGIAVGRYVLMPDHAHLFVQGGPDFVLSGWVRLLRRSLSKAIPAQRPHWQQGFFDHLLRSDESYAQKWEYVRRNPVRAGLSTIAEDWPYQGEIVRIDRA